MSKCITESQICWGWKAPLESSLNLLFKTDSSWACFIHIQLGFEYLQQRQFHSFSAQSVLVFNHPHSKGVFPYVQTKFPMFHFVPTASCCAMRYHREESGFIFFTLLFFIHLFLYRYLYILTRLPVSLLLNSWTVPNVWNRRIIRIIIWPHGYYHHHHTHTPHWFTIFCSRLMWIEKFV